jgi:hypothetical protein
MDMICPKCKAPWPEGVGKYPRHGTPYFNYRCPECGSKRQPVPAEDIEELEGGVEYTPKHELTDTGYKINYKNTYVVASHEELRKAFMMYCIGKLTMNQVSLEMTWTREEFNAIKTAFHITKDAAPFTPYELDTLSAEEMGEIMRIEKKRYALATFAANSHKDIEREIDRHHKVDYLLEKIFENVNKMDKSDFTVLPDMPVATKDYIIKITDEHAGLECDSLYNTYNLDVMRERFEDVVNWIVGNIPKGIITIESGGDLVHGLIHGSTEKASTYVMDALEAVQECYIRMIKTLRNQGYVIYFAKANGSHSSLERNKMNRTEEENLGRTLPFLLKHVFADIEGVHILSPVKGTNHTIIPVGHGSRAVLLGHGDEMAGFKSYAALANELSKQTLYQITEVHLGHVHHEKHEFIDSVLVEHSLSFCGSDQYASKKGLVGPCGFTCITYKANGKRKTKEIIEFE